MINFNQFIKVIHDAALSANQALMDENLKMLEKYFEPLEPTGYIDLRPSGSLRPRTVVVQFPTPTQDGMVTREVEVPLISLIPVSMSEIAELKLKTNIEVFVDGEDLQVGFPSRSAMAKPETAAADGGNVSTLEITIRPRDGSQGLTTLIEGYERALRAQMPL